MNWWAAQTPAAPVETTPAPKPVARPKKPAALPAVDAWLVFRTVEGSSGARDRVENLRIASANHLNRYRPGEPKDWDLDIPLLKHDDRDALRCWKQFVRDWEWTPAELACAMEEAAKIEGLEGLMIDARAYREACGLQEVAP